MYRTGLLFRHVIPHCQAWIIFSANVLSCRHCTPQPRNVLVSPLSPDCAGLWCRLS